MGVPAAPGPIQLLFAKELTGILGMKAMESELPRSGSGEWIGVDLDGTLAHYDEFRGASHIGAPVPLMLKRVVKWLQEGRDVRIFTARVHPANSDANVARAAIEAWCRTNLGRTLPITSAKDKRMIELWDDRCVQVELNTGRRLDGIPD